jgi:hypothetical protein
MTRFFKGTSHSSAIKTKIPPVSIPSLEADKLFAKNLIGHELMPSVQFPFGHSTGPTFHPSCNLIRHADDELTTALRQKATYPPGHHMT